MGDSRKQEEKGYHRSEGKVNDGMADRAELLKGSGILPEGVL